MFIIKFMVKNVYIHIPFCKQKCNYCSFVSYSCLEQISKYIPALKSEIKTYYSGELLKTLYFGGGTPSLLNSDTFFELVNLFHIDENTEITVEINPETLSDVYLYQLKNIGINRLSFGCQTFNNRILKLIGRRHCAEDVIRAIELAHNNGFKNINLDFIYGLPEQSIQDFEKDLQSALTMGIQHISLYGLKIEDGCYFHKFPPQTLPDEDDQADMYLKAIDILSKGNFEHYEISNFAQKGFESRHNLNYWNNQTYYGFGAAAHGYVDGVRYANQMILEKYINNPVKHFEERILTIQEQLEEEIFLGFRRIKGINISEINKKFSIDFNTVYKIPLDKYLCSGHINKTSSGFKLSKSGILVSNIILADFLQ